MTISRGSDLLDRNGGRAGTSNGTAPDIGARETQ